MADRPPRPSIVAPGASPEEAAAVVAALQRFLRDTAPAPAAPTPAQSPWQRAALREGVELGWAGPGYAPLWD